MLNFATLDGADFGSANLVHSPGCTWPDDGCTHLASAQLFGAELKGARLNHAQLQGALLGIARLQGANLIRAQLQGAVLENAQLQGASLDRAQLQGASLKGASVWRTRQTGGSSPSLALSTLDQLDYRPFDAKIFKTWRDKILAELPPDPTGVVNARLSVLDPDKCETGQRVVRELLEQGDNLTAAAQGQPLAALLIALACAPENAPYIARGLIHNNRLLAIGSYLHEVAEKLKDPKGKGCRGAEELNSADLADLNFLIEGQPHTGP